MNSNPELYPWQSNIWNTLCNSIVRQRTAHALLFAGPKGIGKLEFAIAFKKSLLCSENNPGDPGCGACRFCKMEYHPDFFEVTLEVDEKTNKQSKVIKIDQIRKLIEFSLLHSHFGKAKVIIIHPAEAMNVNASNALLKILEEPPADTYFVLVSNDFHLLSATIKSRCQLVRFSVPELSDSVQWLNSHAITNEVAISCLQYAFNAPLTARELADSNYIEQHSGFILKLLSITNNTADPMVVADSWLKIEPNLPLQALYSCLSDLILLKTVRSGAVIINKLNFDILQNIANNVSFAGLYVILDKVASAKQQIHANIAILGVYEDILNLWQRLTCNVNLTRK